MYLCLLGIEALLSKSFILLFRPVLFLFSVGVETNDIKESVQNHILQQSDLAQNLT